MSILIYSCTLIVIVTITYINEYSKKRINFNKNLNSNEVTALRQEYKVPLFNIFLITIILSLYSAYLATSGYLTDTVRYAWSFLYRYPAYYESLETMLDARTEVGYLLINMLIGSITNEPYWLFLFVAFITTFINLYTAAKISKSYALIVFLYLISLYFFQTTYLLRQTLAVSFANLAFLAYLKDLKFKYFLFCVIALTFHATAIILLPLFFVFKKVKAAKTYFYIVIISILVFFLFGIVFNTILPRIPYIGQFINTDNLDLSVGGGSFTAIFKGLPFYFLTILALVKRNSLKKIMYKADFYITCSVFYSICWLLSYNMYWFFRVGWYFLLPTLALVPSLFGAIKNPKERILYYIVFLFTLIIITYRQIFITLQ